MNPVLAMFTEVFSRKALVFALLGGGGCCMGWLIGEPFLWLALSSVQEQQAPSLLTQTPAAAPPPEFKSRLDREGAKSGDIQLSLIWDNTNDLDLHCIDSEGNRIFFKQKRAPSGGHLDVDQNASCERSVTNPVENIYWPTGGAPDGRYRVQVHYYKPCSRTIETPFQVSWLVGGARQTQQFRATQVNEFIDVTNFEVRQELKLLPELENLTLRSGEVRKVRVEVVRRFCRGPVALLVSHPSLAASPEVIIPEGESLGVVELMAKSRVDPSMPVQITARLATLQAKAEIQATTPAWWSWWTIIVTALWTALLAAGLALALVLGQNRYLNRPLFAEPRLLLIVLGCALAGIISGGGGQMLQFVLALVEMPMVLGYLAGWVVLGGLVGRGVGFFIPNLDGNKAMIAGAVGGALGVIGFFIGSLVTDTVGRFLGAAILGACIGLMMVLVEVGFRLAWLEVQFSATERITVNLGPEPIKVGSNAQACTIFARGAEPVAARYYLRNGEIICHELGENRETVVRNGDQKQVGATLITVRTGQSTPSVSSSSPPATVRPVPPPVVPPPSSKPAAPTQPAATPKPPTGNPAGCPSCGRAAPGNPGARYCMICDRAF